MAKAFRRSFPKFQPAVAAVARVRIPPAGAEAGAEVAPVLTGVPDKVVARRSRSSLSRARSRSKTPSSLLGMAATAATGAMGNQDNLEGSEEAPHLPLVRVVMVVEGQMG